jgi:hypothetical protein
MHACVPRSSSAASYDVQGIAHTVPQGWDAVRVIACIRRDEAAHMFCDLNHKRSLRLPVISHSGDGKPLAVIGYECGEVSRSRRGGANGTSREIHESEHVAIAIEESVFQKRVPPHRTCSDCQQEDYRLTIT